jgi:hypothetical protein
MLDLILSHVSVTKEGFRLVIGFINHVHVVTTTKYNTVTDFHTTNYSTLFSVYFYQSPLSVSWQRIYNTLTVNKSSNHTLSLYWQTYNSSSTTIFPTSDLRRLVTALHCTLIEVKVRVTLRLAVYRQSVRLGVKPLETHDQTFFFQLNSCGNSSYVTSSLTRRWVCLL